MPKYRKVIYHNYKKEQVNGKNVQQPIPVYEIKFLPVAYTPNNLKTFSSKLKNSLTPDLLPNKHFKEQNKTNPMFGHCVHVAQALYYLFDTDKLVPYKGRGNDFNEKGEWHWWLQDGKKIIDITKTQYTSQGLAPPYENGKPFKKFNHRDNCKQAPCFWEGYWQGRMKKSTLTLIERIIDCRSIQY